MSSFRGVGSSSDFRFSNKAEGQRRVLAASAPPEFGAALHLARVRRPQLNAFIASRMTALLGGVEDEISISMVQQAVAEARPP